MSNRTQQTIFASFQSVSGGGTPQGEQWGLLADVTLLTSTISDTFRQVATASSQQTGALGQNTSAILDVVRGTVGASGSGELSAGSIASTVFKSGLGLVPLITGLFGLFGGGEETPPPLIRYQLPPSVQVNAAEWGGAVGDAEYDQSGTLRPFVRDQVSSPTTAQAGRDVSPATSAPAAQVAPQPVTINIQALDSQSILDRSQDIARAVREAMLSLGTINDVVNDL